MSYTLFFFLSLMLFEYEPTPNPCNEGAVAQFDLIFPERDSVLKPGKHQVLLTTNGYLGLEQGGYQKLLLTDNRAGKTAVNEFLALSPVSSSLSRITLESPMIDFKIGHVYDVSVVYAEAPSPMLCHPEHKQPVGSFLVDIPGISER